MQRGNIMIHRYHLDDFFIVIDTCSGSVHVVDEIAYEIIGCYEQKSREEILPEMARRFGEDPAEIAECYDQITELKEQGTLFSPDVFEPLAGELKKKTAGVVKALCLHVAHTCNLNCAYCFASQGRYHGERALMSFEVGKQALDFLVAHSGSRHNLEVDFFGGEPLMNFDVVKQLVAYARSIEEESGKHFRFTLTTNGLLIDDPKFQKLVNARGGKKYYMRGTFTHANPDFLEDIRTMLDLGFTELSMEPVVCAAGDPAALTEEDLPVVLKQYEDLARLMLARRREGKPFTFYHYMLDLSGGPCIYKRISGCGSGTEYMAVTPLGDLYPCHQFVGEEKFRLGDVWQGVTNPGVQEEFAACNVYAREECRDCWARLYCSGGCAANAYHATGSVRGVYRYGCELFRKRMECAIMIQAALQAGDEQP